MSAPENNKDFAALRLVVVVFAFLIAIAYVPRLFGSGCGRMAGKDAPELTASLVLNGEPGKERMALSELRGKVVVLDFWATWCGPCRAEAPIMNALYQRHKSEGVVVVVALPRTTFAQSSCISFLNSQLKLLWTSVAMNPSISSRR